MVAAVLQRLARSKRLRPLARWRPLQPLVRRLRLAIGRTVVDPIERAGVSGYFAADDIQRVCDTYFDHGAAEGGPWDPLRHAHLVLPDWFKRDLDPLSAAYAEQQQRLWRLISGVDRPYEPDVDEREAPLSDVDAVRLPAYYARRDAEAVGSASDHTIATGMILKHSGLKAGDRALEYGAGFGQTALALARLGVQVDTVDISRVFCGYVQQQADFFKVPLQAFYGHFGDTPRPSERYDLIWFYESFHHCLDFQGLLQRLPHLLADGGRVLLAGEPMVEHEYDAVPYPWGVRLHSEVVAVMRKLHWFELGFSEDFLYQLFVNAGFVGERHRCEPSLFGRTYVFQRRPETVEVGTLWLPPVMADGWHAGEPEGRWTKARASLPLDVSQPGLVAEIDLSNRLRVPRTVELRAGGWQQRVVLAPGEDCSVRIPRGARLLELRTQTSLPSLGDRLVTGDSRALGVLVRRLRYEHDSESDTAVVQPVAPAIGVATPIRPPPEALPRPSQTIFFNSFECFVGREAMRVSGQANVGWQGHFRQAYGAQGSALVVGCADGWVEHGLFAQGIVDQVFGIDASPLQVDQAREAAALKGLRSVYEVVDTDLYDPGDLQVNLVVSVAALNRVTYLNRLVHRLARTCTGGLLVVHDYTGPSRYQYGAELWARVVDLHSRLPPKYRVPLRYPHMKTLLSADRAAAVHSGEQLQVVQRHFDVLRAVPLGGGLAHPLLLNNHCLYDERHSEEGRAALELILHEEELASRAGVDVDLFTFYVARPKAQPAPTEQLQAWQDEEDAREALAHSQGGRYDPPGMLELIYDELAATEQLLAQQQD